jgi:hypothetical protein
LLGSNDPATFSYAPYVVSTTTVAPKTVYRVVARLDRRPPRPVNDSSYGGVIAAKGWGTLPSPHFHGSLDEIAIYETALTSKQVKAHHREGTTKPKR